MDFEEMLKASESIMGTGGKSPVGSKETEHFKQMLEATEDILGVAFTPPSSVTPSEPPLVTRPALPAAATPNPSSDVIDPLSITRIPLSEGFMRGPRGRSERIPKGPHRGEGARKRRGNLGRVRDLPFIPFVTRGSDLNAGLNEAISGLDKVAKVLEQGSDLDPEMQSVLATQIRSAIKAMENM